MLDCWDLPSAATCEVRQTGEVLCKAKRVESEAKCFAVLCLGCSCIALRSAFMSNEGQSPPVMGHFLAVKFARYKDVSDIL